MTPAEVNSYHAKQLTTAHANAQKAPTGTATVDKAAWMAKTQKEVDAKNAEITRKGNLLVQNSIQKAPVGTFTINQQELVPASLVKTVAQATAQINAANLQLPPSLVPALAQVMSNNPGLTIEQAGNKLDAANAAKAATLAAHPLMTDLVPATPILAAKETASTAGNNDKSGITDEVNGPDGYEQFIGVYQSVCYNSKDGTSHTLSRAYDTDSTTLDMEYKQYSLPDCADGTLYVKAVVTGSIEASSSQHHLYNYDKALYQFMYKVINVKVDVTDASTAQLGLSAEAKRLLTAKMTAAYAPNKLFRDSIEQQGAAQINTMSVVPGNLKTLVKYNLNRLNN